jgi:hypothetical protein
VFGGLGSRVTTSRPPDAAGLRFEWSDIPGRVRAAVENRLGSHLVWPRGSGPKTGVASSPRRLLDLSPTR